MERLLHSKRSSLLSSLAMQTMTLKVMVAGLSIVVVTETIGLIALAFKRPLIVAIENNQPRAIAALNDEATISLPEFRAYVTDLLNRKFSRTPTPETQREVCRYFAEGLKEACEREANNKKLLIPQDFVIEEIAWDERMEKAQLRFRRYATFNGTVSAVDLRLTLGIQKRRRTVENPWGLFINEWKEEVQK